MDNAEKFLDLYKSLEEALETRYRERGKSTSSPVSQYLKEREAEPFRNDLDLCRQVRNLLSHTADVDGETPVQPADALLHVLREVLDFVQRPPLAVEYATPYDALLRARPDDLVMPVMRRMVDCGFSHVPVMRGRLVLGVFSASTPFSQLITGRTPPIDEQTEMSALSNLTRIDQHLTERFLFVPDGISVPEAQRLFTLDRKREKRLAALFLTSNGQQSGDLTAMMTPWDFVK